MIELENISVNYRVANEKIHSIKEYIIKLAQRKLSYHQFHALNNINLTVQEGEILGLIGHNGAGKSTLLKVIARVLRPTTGRIRLRGRVSPLLELGAGFNVELTGRENVFLNSALLGFTKQDIRSRFDRIVAFAGLEEFIDTPVRNYSTGMISRLGFAIATDVQPEILIIDEVLSVGDSDFQAKSSLRIEKFCQSGTTILIVSHDLDAIEKICSRVAWLHHGEIKEMGEPKKIINSHKQNL